MKAYALLLILFPLVSFASSFTVDWDAATHRSDGSPYPAAEQAGYTIYYGTSSGNYTTAIPLSDPTIGHYTIVDVPDGLYYVVMTSVDTGGRESVFSPEVTKQVGVPKPIAPPNPPSNVTILE